jgi:fructokinase
MDLDRPRIGLDLGGTKIEAIVLDRNGGVRARRRISAPRHDYQQTVRALRDLALSVETDAGAHGLGAGIGIPGSISKRTGRVQNANSTWLNGQPLGDDLSCALGRPVAVANDANCFALSEASDGAATGVPCVAGIILGTGAGSGIVVNGHILDGPLGIGGEWGHNPLPWAGAGELPGSVCWCGRRGCIETWVSGPALAADHLSFSGQSHDAEAIHAAALAGEPAAQATLQRHAHRLARSLAHLVNIVDPDVIVLGGGLSQLPHLYRVLPGLMAPHIFADQPSVTIKPPKWGDASGVRGAARLVPARTSRSEPA